MTKKTPATKPDADVIISPLDFTSEAAPPTDVADALNTIDLMVQFATPEVRATVRNETKKIRAALEGK